ncbi:MAG TPA: energy transducer TonB [Flavobacteriales bacterium]|nr:energy transducer TonB [Flavobacteriales bacterium]
MRCSLLFLGYVAIAGCKSKAPAVGVGDPDCCIGHTIYEDPDLTKVPEFPGGNAAMYTWLGNRLTKPADAAEVKEDPLVQFNVTCTGTLTDIAVKVPAHPALDSLALQAVRDMPPWVPGRIKDKVVCTFHVITVTFE